MADQPSPRRRFQFSLRLAMLLMTLACVIASVVGWRLYLSRLDDEIRVPVLYEDYDHARMMRDMFPARFKNSPPLPPRQDWHPPQTWPPPRGLWP